MVRVVNTNVQSPVPLQGKGYTRRSSENYVDGEYPQLDNVFITDRGLECRNGISMLVSGFYTSYLGGSTKNYSDVIGFIGSMGMSYGENAFVVGKNCLFAVTPDTSTGPYGTPYWDPETLMAGQTNTKFHIPVKAMQYQNFSYFILMKANETAGAISSIDYQLAVQGTPTVVPAPTNLINRAVPTINPNLSDFVDAFIHKDRLWIVTKDTIYFSGVGSANHTNFTAPVGGFVKYSGRIKTVQALKDSVYVICEREVYVLTYSSDPNTDAINIAVSSIQGGDSSCVHENTVYFTDGIALYSVSNNNVNKLMQLDLFERYPDVGGRPYQSKLIAYRNKLVLIYLDAAKFGTSGAATPWVNRGIKLGFNSNANQTYNAGANADPLSYPYANYSNVFMINMDNGSVTKIVFRDQRITSPAVFNGFIVDAITVMDDRGTPQLMFMTSADRGSNTTFNFLYYYIDNPSEWLTGTPKTNKSFDSYYSIPSAGGSLTTNPRWSIPYAVFFHKWVPDGAQYLMKKFRSFVLSGNLPDKSRFSWFFGNNQLGVVTDFKTVDAQDSQVIYPQAYRIGINQRARSVSFGVHRTIDYQPVVDPLLNEDIFMLEDVRAYWTYTGKGLNTIQDKAARK